MLAKYLGVTPSELLGEKIPPVSNVDTSDTMSAGLSEETEKIMGLLNQLEPENLKKALDHLDYLIARQEGEEGKK